MVTICRAADAQPGALAGERVAVLGYGNLGRTAALNLRDTTRAKPISAMSSFTVTPAARQASSIERLPWQQ